MNTLDKIKNLFAWEYYYNAEGYAETRGAGTVNGHNVQVVQEDGSKYCTVFVDGKPAHLPEAAVMGHIVAKAR